MVGPVHKSLGLVSCVAQVPDHGFILRDYSLEQCGCYRRSYSVECRRPLVHAPSYLEGASQGAINLHTLRQCIEGVLDVFLRLVLSAVL